MAAYFVFDEPFTLETPAGTFFAGATRVDPVHPTAPAVQGTYTMRFLPDHPEND